MAINMDALIAKRAEVLGEGHKFDIDFAGTKFWFVAPELASEDWNRRLEDLQEDSQDGVIAADQFREEFLSLLLGEQVEAFSKAAQKLDIDPLIVARMAMEEHSERVGKVRSRRSSSNGPKSAKRR